MLCALPMLSRSRNHGQTLPLCAVLVGCASCFKGQVDKAENSLVALHAYLD